MNKDEMKNKYSAFITEISEILGLGKPVDILKLCVTTDLFFQPLEKRIAELEEERSDLDMIAKNYAIKNADLEKENAKLEEEWQEQVQKATDEGYARTLQTMQLTKAKEIIKELVRVEYADFTNGDYSNELSKVLEKAEQFLKIARWRNDCDYL